MRKRTRKAHTERVWAVKLHGNTTLPYIAYVWNKKDGYYSHAVFDNRATAKRIAGEFDRKDTDARVVRVEIRELRPARRRKK